MNNQISAPPRGAFAPHSTHRVTILLTVVLLATALFYLSFFTVQNGMASTAVNGGASICGIKFNDLNGDGQWDGATEPTIPNWEIQLSGAGLVTTTFTNVDGFYCFQGLADGAYNVGEIMQSGWVQTFPDPNNGTGGGYDVFIQGGQSRDGIDFGNHLGSVSGDISGSKFYDHNNNGIWDPGEPGLSGWVIQLTDGITVWTTTTGMGGHYGFSGLMTNTYTISEVAQAGWVQTVPLTPSHYVVSFVPSQSIPNLNFGNYAPPAEIHGHKFNDLDGNGIQDVGEPGLPNWTINAQGNGLNFTELTDANGDYAFLGLPPGEYIIYEGQPAPYWNGQYMVQWTQTAPASGTYTPTLTPGQVLTGTIFGNWISGQPDFCMIPWDNHFLNTTVLTTEVYIFNASATGQESYTVQMVGPSTITTVTPLPITLGAFQYGIVEVQIAYPAVFTMPYQNSQFQAIVTNLNTNTTFTCQAALWAYSPQWWTSPNVNSGLGGGIPMGYTQNISFTVSSPGGGRMGAATADYRIWAMSRGFTDTSLVSLNGLPPGTVITGQVSLNPGQALDIPVSIVFTEYNLLAPTDIILELDVDGDQVADIVTSYLIFTQAPKLYLPLITRP